MFRSALFLGKEWVRLRWRWVSGQTSLQQGLIALGKGFLLIKGQLVVVERGLIDGGFDLAQQVGHLRRPGLVVLLVDKGQFAQMMSITQSVATVLIGKVGLPVIVNGRPAQMRQDVHRRQRDLTPFGVQLIVG